MKIVLTGGGTGGHVIPALSLIPDLEQHFDSIYYIGSNGIEKDIAAGYNIPFYEIPVVKFNKSNLLKNILLPYKLFESIKAAQKILVQLKPDVVFSKGGYVALPVCIAAHKLKIKIVSHESDITMGRANGIIYRLCKKMCVSFDICKNRKKCVYTSSPVRKELFSGNKFQTYNKYNLNKALPTILVMGGSTGAKFLNDTLFKYLPALTKEYNVIHIVGKNKGNADIKYQNYAQLEYTDKMGDIFSVTDFVISRAGSNAIFEFLALRKPMLLIPLSKRVSRGDQVLNANYFKNHGFAEVLTQEELEKAPELLIKKLQLLIKNKDAYIKRMPPYQNAARKITDVILQVTKM